MALLQTGLIVGAIISAVPIIHSSKEINPYFNEKTYKNDIKTKKIQRKKY